jgi:hypothetical protein
MSTRLFGIFVLVALLALGSTATAQRKTASVAGDGVVALNVNSNSLSTPNLFVDVAGNRVCGLLALSPVSFNCEPLPITIPAGAPVVALNPFDNGYRYFAVGTGQGATQLCVVTSSPTVGTTVCTLTPF